METFLEQVFNGVSQGSILLLIALGLTFTFGQMGVINMAHGELIMIGAYTPYVLQTEVALFAGATSTAYVLSLPVAFVAAGLDRRADGVAAAAADVRPARSTRCS